MAGQSTFVENREPIAAGPESLSRLGGHDVNAGAGPSCEYDGQNLKFTLSLHYETGAQRQKGD
jgi:hypothetical protein